MIKFILGMENDPEDKIAHIVLPYESDKVKYGEIGCMCGVVYSRDGCLIVTGDLDDQVIKLWPSVVVCASCSLVYEIEIDRQGEK